MFGFPVFRLHGWINCFAYRASTPTAKHSSNDRSNRAAYRAADGEPNRCARDSASKSAYSS